MKIRVLGLFFLVLLIGLAIAGCGKGGKKEEPKRWKVTQQGNVLAIAYGCESEADSPQYAALHLDSSYFRMNYGPNSSWGTSAILFPSFWEATIEPPTWVQVLSYPAGARKLAVINDTIFAQTGQDVWKTSDMGTNWGHVPANLEQYCFHAVAADQGDLYLTCSDGILASSDLGETLSWSIRPSGGCTGLDFKDGYGWATVADWGGVSGVIQKTPSDPFWRLRGTWVDQATDVVADSLDPLNIAYVFTSDGSGTESFRTLDNGLTWAVISHQVLFSTVLEGRSTIFGASVFSEDRGQTWQPLGVTANALVEDEQTGILFAATTNGVYAGLPGNWEPYGLAGEDIQSIAVCGRWLMALSNDGCIFKAAIGTTSSGSVYNQGAPVTASWQVAGSGDLVVSLEGTIAGLSIDGEIRLSPPEQDLLTARVTINTTGDVTLADRPGEAFKPIMLSSMHISGGTWDTQSAYVGVSYQIPQSGWIIQPPVVGKTFGLIGGTSLSKSNAPTIEVVLDQNQLITGWVTPSNDPNDDNVGFWAASNTVLRSWTYTVSAKP